MRKKAVSVFVVTFGLLSVSMPLFAHHGTAVFEAKKTLTMKGVVTEWDWFNPHCPCGWTGPVIGALALMHWVEPWKIPVNLGPDILGSCDAKNASQN